MFFAGQNHVAIQVVSSQAEHELITSDPRDLERKRQFAMSGQKDNRTIQELAVLYEPPVTQRMIIEKSESKRQKDMLTKAVEQRKTDVEQIKRERSDYEIELEKKLQEQRNAPQQQGVLKDIENSSLTEQIAKKREELQKDSLHITPQGYIEQGDGKPTNTEQQ